MQNNRLFRHLQDLMAMFTFIFKDVISLKFHYTLGVSQPATDRNIQNFITQEKLISKYILYIQNYSSVQQSKLTINIFFSLIFIRTLVFTGFSQFTNITTLSWCFSRYVCLHKIFYCQISQYRCVLLISIVNSVRYLFFDKGHTFI